MYLPRLGDRLPQIFLVIFVLSVFVVSCGDDNGTVVEPTTIERPPDFGGSESDSPVTKLFVDIGESAAGEITGAGVGWMLGALGLSDASPDYTEQLAKIDEDLQEIISELDEIDTELHAIDQELRVINCSEQQTALTTETGRIDFLLELYASYVAAASAGGRTPNSTLSDWADQVLAQGVYTAQTPMGQVLTTVANKLVQPSSGAIWACVTALPPPAPNSFDDSDYYAQVSLFTNYYYYYQTQGLLLLSEALHYKAWVAAGSPSSSAVSADSISTVCGDPAAQTLCTELATFTNGVYNALLDQFTVAGAGYTDDSLLSQNDLSSPLLWVKSLEDYTTAAGDACADPLTSANPCGVTVGVHGEINPGVVYRGYLIDAYANSAQLSGLLSGWSSGTPAAFLEATYGFKNMQGKLVKSTSSFNFPMPGVPVTVRAVCFVDMDIAHHYDWSGVLCSRGPYTDLISGTRIPETSDPTSNTKITFYPNSQINYSNRNNFASFHATMKMTYDGESVVTPFKWQTEPGWLASNTGNAAKQFRWPVGEASLFTDNCTGGRSDKNVGGVWTKCGDDFIAFFDHNVPRPATCDDVTGVSCRISEQEIMSAKRRMPMQGEVSSSQPIQWR